MGKENIIKFNEVNMYLSFTLDGEVFGFDGEYETIKVTSPDDIIRILEDYKNENWNELFKNYDSNDIDYVRFNGIQFFARDENGNRLRVGNDSIEPYANVQFDINNLVEENAKKIQEIRKIIGIF